MASLIPNHQPTSNWNTSFADPARKKKKKKQLSSSSRNRGEAESHTRWRSEKQQRIYSAKLVQALRQVRLNSFSATSPRRSKTVREAADRALAVAARGRTLWSRAILTNRIKLKFRKQKRPRSKAIPAATVVSTGSGRSRKSRASVVRLKAKSLPAVQRKVRVLGGLVPGCRKQSMPVILEEATDYIQALEMQVRAMSSLANLLSGYTSGAGSTSGSAPPPS